MFLKLMSFGTIRYALIKDAMRTEDGERLAPTQHLLASAEAGSSYAITCLLDFDFMVNDFCSINRCIDCILHKPFLGHQNSNVRHACLRSGSIQILMGYADRALDKSPNALYSIF